MVRQRAGLVLASVRAYDPVLERFLQPDPSELEGLFSYSYAGDNPTDLGDPTGLLPTPPEFGTLLPCSGPSTPFESAEEAQKAISALNGSQLGGRALTVNVAKPREERSAGGGGRREYGGGGGGRDRY